jgi:hypothetical protein
MTTEPLHFKKSLVACWGYTREAAIRPNQEITMLSLHLLQLCLVYINTLMIQQVLHKPQWQARMHSEDLRALTPLIYSHVTPYGTFRLDMNERLVIETDIAA